MKEKSFGKWKPVPVTYERYAFGPWVIEITRSGMKNEAYLSHIDYAEKMLMFGDTDPLSVHRWRVLSCADSYIEDFKNEIF